MGLVLGLALAMQGRLVDAVPRFEQAIAAGRLEVVAAKITAVEPTESGARVSYRRRRTDADEVVEVARIVECTGIEPPSLSGVAPPRAYPIGNLRGKRVLVAGETMMVHAAGSGVSMAAIFWQSSFAVSDESSQSSPMTS